MAGSSRGALAKKKKPVVRVTQKAKEQYKILKAASGEPTWADELITGSKLVRALNWYNEQYASAEAKAFILTYLKNTNRMAEHKRLQEVPDKWITRTTGWIARIRSIGGRLPESELTTFESTLAKMLERDYSRAGKLEGSEDSNEAKPTTKQKAKSNPAYDAICEIEEQIDKFYLNKYSSEFSVADYLKQIEANPAIAKSIHDFYEPKLTEIEHAYNKTDAGIVEGYAAYSKDKLEKLYDFHVMIVDDVEIFLESTKKERKPRTPKPVSVEKKMQHFKCQQVDSINNTKSVKPETLLGAGELWAFNTKYNQLTVFRMANGSGLDVNRTAITNFDPATSSTKKLKAKDVANVLSQVTSGGKIVLRHLMTNVKGSPQKLQERMNENTILLRVVPK